jgi:MFS family permease
MILLSGVTALLIPTATTFNEILVYLALFGVGTGGWFLMVPLLLAEYLGVEKIGSSYGLVRLFQAVTNLFGPIIAGYLYGTLGKLEISFFFMGSCMMASGVVSLFLPLALRTLQSKST